ncbi:hypothetical protein [Pandoravirus japonicus]|uniref:Uncharacterized protein n=1 Tax=Pandoravirus japonicus TaxID=2823154 RepID=A0A811BRH4_9VIRU|nr:hypothetical protein [Pandoravirus japonicus]
MIRLIACEGSPNRVGAIQDQRRVPTALSRARWGQADHAPLPSRCRPCSRTEKERAMQTRRTSSFFFIRGWHAYVIQ